MHHQDENHCSRPEGNNLPLNVCVCVRTYMHVFEDEDGLALGKGNVTVCYFFIGQS